jgi:hypothetical protein
MKILLGFGDSEGTPHVKTNDSELWNAVILFKYVVDTTWQTAPEEVFHVTHLSINKKAKRKDIKDSLDTHFTAIEFIKNVYDCDAVHVGFWGAAHDMAVLRTYGKVPIIPFDLLSHARKLNDDIESFNIGKLCTQFDIQCATKVHTGLGDVIRMVKLFPHLGIEVNDKLVFGDPKPKHAQTSTGSVRRHGVPATAAPPTHRTVRMAAPRKRTVRMSTGTTADIANIFARKLKL